MNRFRPYLALVLITFVAVVVVGCGGGGSSSSSPSTNADTSTEGSNAPSAESSGSVQADVESTKAVYIEEADAICRSFKEETADQRSEFEEVAESEDLETPAQEVKFSRLMGELIAASKQEGTAIKALEPPPEDRDIVDKWIDGGEEANALLTEANEALEAGEPYKFGELFKEGAALSQKSHGIAQGYGFEVCGAEEE